RTQFSPPPGLQDFCENKKKRIRSFFWKTIPEEQVRGKNNIWTIPASQNYQIDSKTIEEFFGQQEEATTLDSRSRSCRRSFKETREEINILDGKRSMNIGIFLKQFKKSLQSVIDDLNLGKSELYGSETLHELLKLLPETEEVSKGLCVPCPPKHLLVIGVHLACCMGAGLRLLEWEGISWELIFCGG
uniref:FH2 domain containing 1 n=1 Tax=Sphenodon punctatus TaxID=8508 RepID=A0A8D0HF91_SPHPU